MMQPYNPQFFQPLVHGFLHNFTIPKSFVKQHLEESLRDKKYENAELRDKYGRIWYVKIVISRPDNNNNNNNNNNSNSKYYFKDGSWEDFCKDNDLHVGDFVVFELLAKFVFRVLIFDPTSCERQVSPLYNPLQKTKGSSSSSNNDNKGNLRNMRRDDDGSKEKANSGFKLSGYPYVHTVIKPYFWNWNAFAIPTEFARKNGIGKRWCDIVVIDEKGRSWSMKLRHRKVASKGGAGTPYICVGWRTFHKANHLRTGDQVILELIDSGDIPVVKFHCKS